MQSLASIYSTPKDDLLVISKSNPNYLTKLRQKAIKQ
jgi:hypothetical protein